MVKCGYKELEKGQEVQKCKRDATIEIKDIDGTKWADLCRFHANELYEYMFS